MEDFIQKAAKDPSELKVCHRTNRGRDFVREEHVQATTITFAIKLLLPFTLRFNI
jgi:hypothetical protein